VSAVGLGCMGMSQAYGPSDDAQSLATLERALDRGVTLLDSAMRYGGGHNERLLAGVLRRRRDPASTANPAGATRCSSAS
jgi:aryl-alcohol dehydrogenase-like predicted oxidoreductase